MTYPSFSVGEVLTANDMNAVGLWKIAEVSLTTVTNNISNVFSSTYDSYRIVGSNIKNGSTTSRVVSLRYRTTSDDANANYFQATNFYYPTNQAGSSAASGTTSAELFTIGDTTNDGAGFVLDVFNPNLQVGTVHMGQAVAYQTNISNWVMRSMYGGVNTTTQYTGFSIIGTTDNLSGTIRVYGYRN